MNKRIIFHIDINNAFLSWTAVYLLKKGYKEDIREVPAVIGGDENSRRGIVLAKSPVAKKLGIVTAETLYQARKKCPNLKVFPPNYKWYEQRSNEFLDYLSQYSPNIEKFSIDECFLDMTGTKYLYKDYRKLANKIKEEIREKFGYTVNVGIANNKLCAKMASDFEKPDKVHTLYSEEIEEKLWPLPVADLFMVGKKTASILNRININTVEQLAKADEKLLQKYFKNQAQILKQISWGLDDSKVENRRPKNGSISTTETLPYDYTNKEKLKKILIQQTERLTRQLRAKKQYAHTVAIIYKNNFFQEYSHQEKRNNATNSFKEMYDMVLDLFEKSYKNEPIRLIGIRFSDLVNSRETQLSLFEECKDDKRENIDETLDKINNRFGKTMIFPASLNKNINHQR